MSLRVVSAALVLLGLVGGTFGGAFRGAPPAERGGFKVLEGDFHVHSHAGDGLLSPFGLALLAESKGLNVIAITDHNQIYAARAGRWFSQLVHGPTVIVGEEITAPDYHLIGLGLSDRISWRQPLEEATREVHSQGGVAILAHPSQKSESILGTAVLDLDGSEVMHPLAHSSANRAREMRELYERAESQRPEFTAVGSSDYHWFNALGLCRTYVFVRNNSEADILESLRTGRTVVYDLEGNVFGDPELIRILEEQPIKDEIDYDYRGSGPIDVLTRTCGWLGLFGLFIFRRRK